MAWTWPELSLNFAIDLSRPKSTYSEPARWGKTMVPFYFRFSHIAKLSMKNNLHEKRYFFIWWPLEPKLLTLGQIWLKNITLAWDLSYSCLNSSQLSYFWSKWRLYAKKVAIFLKFDLCWLLMTSILTWPENKLVKVWDLVAVYLVSLAPCR